MVSVKEIKENIKNVFADAYADTFGKKIKVADIKLEYPPDISSGDFNIGCFTFAKKTKQNPAEIALSICEKIVKSDLIDEVVAVGPYVNFKINPNALFEAIAEDSISDNKFSDAASDKKERIMVEYLQPNTNKPLHLGHVRNGCLGMAISNLLAATNNEVIKANLINDRGIHISKSMLAWKKWGEDETPESTGMKGDHFVGKWYVRYAKEFEKNPQIEDEAREILKKWEENDPEVIELWKRMNNWVYAGFNITTNIFDFQFDKVYFESDTYKTGKKIIQEGIKKKIFYKDEKGNIVVDLPKEQFGLDEDGQKKKVVLQRADGTSLYMTQDLGTAKLKFEEFGLDQSIYVVGSEQEYHFQCLFAILEMLGYEWAKKCYHLSYGMVYLPEGKMKSREGKVVDADDLMKEMTDLAQEEIAKRTDSMIDKKEISKHAQKIALAAIKFFLLRLDPQNDIHFDPKESLAFEGMTGPYCQYAYARIQSILAKEKAIKLVKENSPDLSLLKTQEDRLLARYVMQLAESVKKSADNLNPSFLCRAIYDVAKTVHQYYQKNRILDKDIPADLAKARLELLKAVGISLKNGLKILGIEIIDKM